MKHLTNTARHAAVVVLAASLAVPGCGNNPYHARTQRPKPRPRRW